MLSNAYFLANFRFDTAENEPSKNLQKKITKFANLLTSKKADEKSAGSAASRARAFVGPGREARQEENQEEKRAQGVGKN